MKIKAPEQKSTPDGSFLYMFCTENRIDRELYWVGFGFQVWCQLLTHILRSRTDSILIADEPEIYLHPDMQRQLLSIFRNAGPDLLLATHSSELVGEAEATEIVLVDKTSSKGRRLTKLDAIQDALEYLGSGHNIALTQIARTRHIVFVEGDDFKFLRGWAERLNLKELGTGLGIVPISVGGFGQWERVNALGWGFRAALNQPMQLAAIFDRDYYCDEEIQLIVAKLKQNVSCVHILQRKEIENYLLLPSVLDRCVAKLLQDRKQRGHEQSKAVVPMLKLLGGICEKFKNEVSGNLVGKAVEHFNRQRSGDCAATISTRVLAEFEQKWKKIDWKLELVPGKQALSEVNKSLQADYGITLTPGAIIRETRQDEIPADLITFLRKLEAFRKSEPPRLRHSQPVAAED